MCQQFTTNHKSSFNSFTQVEPMNYHPNQDAWGATNSKLIGKLKQQV